MCDACEANIQKVHQSLTQHAKNSIDQIDGVILSTNYTILFYHLNHLDYWMVRILQWHSNMGPLDYYYYYHFHLFGEFVWYKYSLLKWHKYPTIAWHNTSFLKKYFEYSIIVMANLKRKRYFLKLNPLYH